MRFLIASDLHGSAYYTRLLLERFREEGADRLLLLGDLLYHGPRNALPEEYDPAAVAAMLNEKKDVILAVKGNCDSAVDQMVLGFPIEAPYLPVFSDGFSLYLTHGDIFTPESPMPMPRGSVYLFGHIHVPVNETRDGILFLNPGSVSIPKGESTHSYMIFEKGVFTFKKIDGTPYDEAAIRD